MATLKYDLKLEVDSGKFEMTSTKDGGAKVTICTVDNTQVSDLWADTRVYCDKFFNKIMDAITKTMGQ